MKKLEIIPAPFPTTEGTGEAHPFHTQRYLFQSPVFDVEFFCVDKIKQLPILLPVGGDAPCYQTGRATKGRTDYTLF